jgi:hypothetical protein
MTDRWQTNETRQEPHAFRDNAGVPVTGLTPTATVRHVDGTANPPTATVAEIGGGGYRLVMSAPATRSLFVVIDGGPTLTATRYVFQSIPVGGYVDQVDATISSRATHAEATSDTAGTTTLVSRLTGPRAAALDNLDQQTTAARDAVLASLTGHFATTDGQLTALASSLTALSTQVATPAQAAALTAARDLILAGIETSGSNPHIYGGATL